MTTFILYDSQYGNTQKLAEAMAEIIKAKAVKTSDFHNDMLKGVSLFIAGSPTQGGRAMVTFQRLLETIPAGTFKNVSVAAFDTRFSENTQNFALKLLMRTIGYAAPKIAKTLESKGGKLIAPPEGFIVTGKEGPVASGEIERAKNWAVKLLKKVS